MKSCQHCNKEFEKHQVLASHVWWEHSSKESREVWTEKQSKKRMLPKHMVRVTCKGCNNPFEVMEVTKRTGEKKLERNYCSKACASKRVLSEEVKKKISDKLKGHQNGGGFAKGYKASEQQKQKIKEAVRKRNGNPFEKANPSIRFVKRVLIEEVGYKCEWCGISEWRQQKIVLEIDHIDGNRSNNKRSNVRLLCPNCHSQTPTFRVKNIKKLGGFCSDAGSIS